MGKKKERKAKLSYDECVQSVLNFHQKKERFEQVQSQFSEIKAQFYSDMEDYFECEGIESKLDLTPVEFAGGGLAVTRKQNSSVKFDADKLEKALGKKLSQDVIIKQYQITDMAGLIAYLKECGVDPRIFKSFLHVSKSVDTKALDQLEELGKITADQVKGCYTITRQKPYFTVNVRKGQDDGE